MELCSIARRAIDSRPSVLDKAEFADATEKQRLLLTATVSSHLQPQTGTMVRKAPRYPCVNIQTPLSRRGTGPGLIIVSADEHVMHNDRVRQTLDPQPVKKWAEEGYSVAEVGVYVQSEQQDGIDRVLQLKNQLIEAVDKLRGTAECQGEEIGLVAFHDEHISQYLLDAVKDVPQIKAVIFYGWSPSDAPPVPVLAHLAGHTRPSSDVPGVTIYTYPSAKDGFFALPAHRSFSAGAAAVSHTRCLSFLKPKMNGPYFDLEAIWDEHTRFEFEDRSVEETMKTMVDEPYVNHVPTLTGGIGRAALTRFYRDHFIFSNPDDAKLELVSRTVGIDRVVDEFLFECTHSRTIDWLIPGIPPTGRRLSVPMTSIVNIRGDKLYHEHIAWDQGTVLRQLGLLPEYLPFPYALRIPGDHTLGDGTRWEYRVPVAGMETSKKMADEGSCPSNEMLEYRVRKVEE
ncbi:hypothetical protein QBC41DRAFT_318552 [Cercophora samala]|uniref:SnoaL-like domain-containing protein n=1 Tax=Cercophora samala TaxID=330535 RepID=A0AA40DB49_9PEZI|nr:hypothetical protein QBC41DRAFT_318552 [Cercophora samala]